jgi:hypothetical protein
MTIPAERVEHVPRRPEWDCRVCGLSWPCPDSRRNLLAEFGEFPGVLAIYLTGRLRDAIHDLALNELPVPADLNDRFVDWARTDESPPQPAPPAAPDRPPAVPRPHRAAA